MKRKVRWTEQALDRLIEIENYIALADPAAAAGVLDRLFAAAERLAAFPALGRLVPELPGSSLRELLDGAYRVVYLVHPEVVEILTVFEGHRRLPKDDLE